MKLFTTAGANVEMDETPDGTTEWRDGCAATLMTTVQKYLYIFIWVYTYITWVPFLLIQKLKLTDNMVYLLAGLPSESYKILREIFEKYEQGSKLNTKKPGTQAKPDCRGSNFRELRNLDNSAVHALLVRVRDGDLPLSQLSKEAKQKKQMHKLKQTFACEVGAESWEQATQAYPHYATEAGLMRFLTAPKLTGPTLVAFQQYCSRAVRTAASAPPPQGCRSSQAVEITVNSAVYYGIHLAFPPEDITYQEIAAHLPQFTGFPLVFMRLAGLTDQKVRSLLYCITFCACKQYNYLYSHNGYPYIA